MRTSIKLGISALVVIVLLGGCYLQQGGWMMINPKYNEKVLLGLTRAEVIHRLGAPSFDPQAASTRPWNDAEDGPDYLGYSQGWASCSITFKNGKVDSVGRSWK